MPRPLNEIDAILVSLSDPRWTILEAPDKLPNSAGLYAAHADRVVWEELGLGIPPDTRPLYIGKAEGSVVRRDVGMHFRDGRTGSSTLRRSLAALLRERLVLRGVPRNPRTPGNFDRFGLTEGDDRKLTGWMRERVLLAAWCAPEGTTLSDIEGKVMRSWEPPLNLRGVKTPWKDLVMAARAVMADQAREWAGGAR